MRNLWAAGLVVVLFAPLAWGQDAADKFQRDVQQLQRETQARFDADLPPAQRALIDYGGYLTLGYLSFDDSAHDNHGLREYELIGYGRINFDGAQEVYFRGRADYDNYNSGDSFEHQADHLEGRVEEGWYRFDLQRYVSVYQGRKIDNDLSVKAGRQFVDWGNGLTLDQYVDGIAAEFQGKHLSLDVLACVTVKETIDFDITRPDFDGNTRRGYFGARLTGQLGRHYPYAYFLLERDYNREESTVAHIIPTRYRYNSYYAGGGSNGTFTDNLAYGAEACFEGGSDLSNSYNIANSQPVGQTSDRIEAYAANLRLDYLLNDRRKTRFGAEFLIASGDRDRSNTAGTFGGNKPHTSDLAFNSLGVIYDGLAFTPPVSNLVMLRFAASTYPVPTGALRGLQSGVDFFVFGKTLQDAPIDEPTADRHYLGCEPDIFINWQIVDDVSFALRYGLFFPGDAIPAGDQNHVRQFLYAAVTYAF
jgi:hypothetical protein